MLLKEVFTSLTTPKMYGQKWGHVCTDCRSVLSQQSTCYCFRLCYLFQRPEDRRCSSTWSIKVLRTIHSRHSAQPNAFVACLRRSLSHHQLVDSILSSFYSWPVHHHWSFLTYFSVFACIAHLCSLPNVYITRARPLLCRIVNVPLIYRKKYAVSILTIIFSLWLK